MMKKENFLVKEIDGRILFLISTYPEKRGRYEVVREEPQILIASSPEWDRSKVKWVAFNPFKKSERETVGGISVPQLLAPIYYILLKYKWSERVKNHFELMYRAMVSMMKCPNFGDCYIQDVTGYYNVPKFKIKRSMGLRSVSYNEPFHPIRDALEVFAYE